MTLIKIAQALLLSFSAVFIMEMGDKTQLTAFALSMKYRSPLKVFFGAIFGLTGVTIIAIIIGIIMKNTIEVSFLKPIIGILFILGGLIFLFIQFRKHHDRPIKICPVDLEFCNKPHENCPDMEHCDIYLKTVIQKGGFIGSITFMFLAELGDKTLLDTLAPATEKIDEWSQGDSPDVLGALQAAADAASEAAESTRGWIAKRGRQYFTGERSIGTLDPGMVAVATMMQAIAKALKDAHA